MGELINSFILGSTAPVVDNGVYFTDTSPTATATTEFSGSFIAENTFNTSLSLSGSYSATQWVSSSSSITKQRVSYDFGVSTLFNKARITNSHDSGTQSNIGSRDIKIYGSTNAADYNVTYGADTALTLIYDGALREQDGTNGADWEYFIFASASYRYVIIDIANNHTSPSLVGIRRIEFGNQTGLLVPSGNPNLWESFSTPTAQATTTRTGGTFDPELSADTDLSLIGGWTNNQWMSAIAVTTLQRWSWDRGSSLTVNKLRISNSIDTGGTSNAHSIKDCVIYGSNNASDYNTTYAADTALVTLFTGTLSVHMAFDTTDWIYPTLLDIGSSYRYIIIDIVDSNAGAGRTGFRKIMTG